MWAIVAAVSYPQRIIGWRGRLPWHLPLELRLFRQLTWGGILVVGRKTWEALPPTLPGREVWVLSQSPKPPSAQARFFSSTDTLLQALEAETRPVFFAGGASIYAWALELPKVSRLYLSWIYTQPPGDTFFPPFSEEAWVVTQWEFFEEKCLQFIRAVYQRI
ncbi:MAG: dihydrofolate reductase [Bacteroidia bacterium]